MSWLLGTLALLGEGPPGVLWTPKTLAPHASSRVSHGPLQRNGRVCRTGEQLSGQAPHRPDTPWRGLPEGDPAPGLLYRLRGQTGHGGDNQAAFGLARDGAP